MKPSVFASFVIFMMVGFRTVFIDCEFNTDILVKGMLIAVIISSALYYYYLNIATEQQSENTNVTYKQQILSWWITAAQYIGFLSTWFLLRLGWGWYIGGLLFLNITYLVWDYFHHEFVWGEKSTPAGRRMFGWDIAGTVFTCLLLAFTVTLPNKEMNNKVSAHHAIAITICGLFVVIQALSGLFMAYRSFGYKPFRFLSMDGSPIKKAPNEKQS